MSFTRVITLAAVAATAFPTVATAAERPPATGTEQSIIAILIGFTPPIGTNHGSFVSQQGIIMSDGRICNPRWGC